MAFLHFLETVRTPFLDALFLALTRLGDETVFIAAALLIFWCIDKRGGYFVLTVGFFGIVANETLKLIFRVQRPWVLDTTLSPVRAALERAVGYSFPSGHTQNAVSLFGSAALLPDLLVPDAAQGGALHRKKRILRTVCLLLIFLVAFSRMYLGVHTPADVGVSAAVASVSLAVLYFLFRKFGKDTRFFPILMAIMWLLTVGFLIFSMTRSVNPESADNTASGIKHGCYMLGGMIGLCVGYPIEKRKIRFETRAPLLGQILKLTVGFILVMLIKSLLKAPLLSLFSDSPLAHTVRYAVTVLFAVTVYPLSFRFFARLGAKK